MPISTTPTISANIVLKDIGPEECISDKLMAEIVRRIAAVVSFADPNVIQRSISQPTDVEKLWFQQNSQGVVTNIKFYNSNTGKWEDVLTTAPEENLVKLCSSNNALEFGTGDEEGCIRMPEDELLKNSANSDNLITYDGGGAITVSSANIRDIAATLDELNKCNVLKKNINTKALSVDRGSSWRQDVGTSGIIRGHLVKEREGSAAAEDIDLSLIPGVGWDEDCPPTHVEVVAVVSIDSGGSYNGNWTDPAVQIKAGVDLTRLVCVIDDQDNAGTVMNTAIVKLDEADPKTFNYHIISNGNANFTIANNYLGLFVSAFIWTSAPPE